MKAGDNVVILNHEIVDGPEVFGAVWCVEVDQESGERGKPVMVGVGSIIPDHPALPAVAAWLAEHGDAHLRELLECAVWVITNGGIEYEQVEYGQALIDMANALQAALTEVER